MDGTCDGAAHAAHGHAVAAEEPPATAHSAGGGAAPVDPIEEAKALVREGRWAELHAKDELRAKHASGEVFAGFSEAGPLNFPPTYLHKHGEGPEEETTKEPDEETAQLLTPPGKSGVPKVGGPYWAL